MIQFIAANWEWLVPALFILLEAVVRITPTEKDNSLLEKVKELFDFILPNLKKGGGKH